MPFVKKECRAEGHVPCSVGDLCYLEYRKLIDAWQKERRWTTAHNLFKQTFDVDDAQAAKTLAYLVFFCDHVMRYEYENQMENGDIE